MNDEFIERCKRKLVELDGKLIKLNGQKSILLYISAEIDKNTNAKLNSVFEGTNLKEEISYLNDWIGFYSKENERCTSKLRRLEQGNVSFQEENPKDAAVAEAKVLQKTKILQNAASKFRQQKPLVKYSVPVLILLLIISTLFLLKPAITGNVVLGHEAAYNKTLNLKINESGNYTLVLENPGRISSIMATGSFSGNGSVKVYIEKNGKRYLILDNRQSK